MDEKEEEFEEIIEEIEEKKETSLPNVEEKAKENDEKAIKEQTEATNVEKSLSDKPSENIESDTKRQKNNFDFKKNKKMVITGLVVILVIVTIVLFFSLTENSEREADGGGTGGVSEEQYTLLDENDTIIAELYAIIQVPLFSHLGISSNEDYLYQGKKLELADISLPIRLGMAFYYIDASVVTLEGGDIMRMYGKDLEAAYKLMFGEFSTYEPIDFTSDNCYFWKYDIDADAYIADNPNCENVSNTDRYNKFVKAMKFNDRIEIVEYVAFVNNDTRKIYKDAAYEIEIATIEDGVSYDKYHNKMNQYYYVFKKGIDGKYYFNGVKVQ